MVKSYELDVERLNEIYTKYIDTVEKYQCYANVQRIILSSRELLMGFRRGTVKIGYCYVGNTGLEYVRHCVILSNEKVIDVTVAMKYGHLIDMNKVKYWVFKEMASDEYLEKIIENDYYLDLKEAIKDDEEGFKQLAAKRHWVLKG